MTLTQLFVVLRARWRCGLLVFVCVVGSVVALSLLLPKQYTASASLVVDVKSPDPIAGLVMAGTTISSYMATQIDVAQSERVALRALRAMRLNESSELRQQWREDTGGKGDFESWAAVAMQEHLDVRPSRESNVFSIAYTSPDPTFSAAVAQAFVQAYVDTTLELKVEPAKQYNTFFDERGKQTREALEQAQSKLSAYQQENGIIATDERLDVENMRLAELSSQMVTLQALAAESRGRQNQASDNTDRMQEVLSDPVVSSLTADLSRQQARLTELSERLGEKHPQVVELSASIGELRKRIQAQSGRVSGSLNVNSNVNQARLAEVNAELKEQRNKILRLKGQRDEAAVLFRDVENAQRAYDAVLARGNQTSLESQNTQTNVSVLKRATPPPFASSPRLLLNTAAGIVLGSLLATGLALVRELLDRRMRTEDDVTEILRQPLLVTLPKPIGESRRSTSRLRLMKARVVTGMPQLAP